MTTLKQLTACINDYLETNTFKDYGPIGLQVDASTTISLVGFAVSANLATFSAAIKKGCQALVVHHGILWDKNGVEPFSGIFGNRIGTLYRKNLSLLAYHMPLDVHPVVGNNAQLIAKLDAQISAPFGFCDLGHWGWMATFEKPISGSTLQKRLKSIFGTTGHTFLFGPKLIKTIAVITGGGADYIKEAREKKADAFITGEVKEPTQEIAREMGISVFAPGHYNTETLGVQALAKVIEKNLGVKTIFLDIPNSL